MIHLKSIAAGLLCLSAYFELLIAKWLCEAAYKEMASKLMREYLEE